MLHPTNAPSPIVVTVSGNTTPVRVVYSANASSNIVVTPLGTVNTPSTINSLTGHTLYNTVLSALYRAPSVLEA